MTPPHFKTAIKYFDYLAKKFPVMCASDEFHFLPRAEKASDYYDKLDNLEAESLFETINVLKEFQKDFSCMADNENDLENLIDLELLKANIAGVLIELERNLSWQHNPLLYIKIAFIGLDHALTKPFSDPEELIERTISRSHKIPGLMTQAVNNITTISDTYYHAAIAMLEDCEIYLSETVKNIPVGKSRDLVTALKTIASSLISFKKFLGSIKPVQHREFSETSLKSNLKDHFLSSKSPDEIYMIAVDERQSISIELEKLRSQIDPGKSWQELYSSFYPSEAKNKDLFSLYRGEMEKMLQFFNEKGLGKDILFSPVEIEETPAYLRSVRGTASFGAAFSTDKREKSYFYISIPQPGQKKPEEADNLEKRFNREYKFLTAHEIVPGHHLLDSVRRRIKNPIRRQIESPLFYEGWATYAESLLIKYGYVDTPIEKLVYYKRRLWRSARCIIDSGMPSGKIKKDNAVVLLTASGFSQKEAENQIYRFQLNPGYQLCYSLGQYEISKLQEAYGHLMPDELFHAFLLEGGQLPFHLIEKRLQSINSGFIKGR
ncbi:MAG: DUF885 family protein [Desulfobacterales bacterium]|nr:DUF885 family protein [Desulfobacterales bacterium]MBT7697518.1 DUF885 family protein [Desulfobacterales bacterium]